MHAYKIRRDEDYVPQTRARSRPSVEAIGEDAVVAPHPSPARMMQAALAGSLAQPDHQTAYNPRTQMAIIGALTILAWVPVVAGIVFAFG
jgi:hypothetical protein